MRRQNLNLLIVDDKIGFYHEFGQKHKSHLAIEGVTDPLRGIALIKKNNYDAVIFDLEFEPASYDEGLNNFLPQAIKMAKSRFPIIVATNDNRKEILFQSMSIGATALWRKEDYDLDRWAEELDRVVTKYKEDLKPTKPVTNKIEQDSFVSSHPKMIALKARLKKLAEPQYKSSSVLLLGESGVGKEVAAQYLHQSKGQPSAPFVSINLSALNESTIESQLFGHVKGAFTDAKEDKSGYFETANEGTLFLDEIGEINLELQVKLLRVLETRTFEKQGSTKPQLINAQLVFATNRDLQKAIAEHQFREDFYQRISALELEIPPLRERSEEIPLLIEHFYPKICQRGHRLYGRPALACFSEAMLNMLFQYSWPGNIRELRNVLEKLIFEADAQERQIIDIDLAPNRFKAAIMQKVPTINDPNISFPQQDGVQQQLPANWPLDKRTAYQQMVDVEARLIQHGGRKDDAAKALGMSSDQNLRYLVIKNFKLYPEIFDNFRTVSLIYKLK